MRRGDPYQQRPSAPPTSGYFYTRSGAPSPSQSHRSYAEMPQHRSRRSMEPASMDEMTPSYFVEHLATFAVGRQFGLVFPQDGIRKLRRLEKNSAIYAQPLVLRLKPQELTVEDENGDLVEKFNMELIDSPTPYVSSDPRDMYNNILLFIVKDDPRDRNSTNRVTEMHIFQCNRVAATDVAQDIKAYMEKHYNAVRNGRRASGGPQTVPSYGMPQSYPADDASISSDSSELFERDVNTLNRCFDDIERFVARIQSAAIAQKELEQQAHRYRTAQRKDKRPSHPDPNGILSMRAQLPMETEFVDILRKFKLSFNLLAKLKSHIHDPNAPELLHFLFTPLAIILDACHWGLGRNIAPQVVAPLLSLEARELLQNCLSSKESDIWMSLGEAWRTPPEDWQNSLPPPYRPIFSDGFAPYGLPEQMNHGRSFPPAPLHRGESAPPAQYRQPPARERSIDTAPNTPLASRSRHPKPQRNMSVDNLDLDRLSLERERIDFERAKMAERERRLLEEERKLREERARVEAERNMLKHETSSVQNGRGRTATYDAPPSSQPSPAQNRAPPHHAPSHAPLPAARPNLPDLDAQSPRQRAFVDDIVSRGGKLVMATFDRVAQNPKELTVSRGEYLEVLEDSKNWWECRNVHQRVGYVPHTILSVVPMQPESRDIYGQPMRDRERAPQLNGHHHVTSSSGTLSPKARSTTYSDAGVQASVQQQVVQQKPQQPQFTPQQQPQFTPQQPQFTPQQQPQFTQHQPQYTPQQPQYPQQQPMMQPQVMPVFSPQPAPQLYQPVPQQPQYAQPWAQQQNIVHVPASIQQNHQQYAPVGPAPQAAPTQDMLALLRQQQAISAPKPAVQQPPAEQARLPIAKPSLLVTTRSKEEQQVIHELSNTVGNKPLRPRVEERTSSIVINENSSAGDVSRWLEDKGFSYRVLELFDGQNGAALFSLNKNHLIQICGRDEGSRLYSQILVQKRKSNYKTNTNAELNAILKMRKTHVEVTNTAPDEEPNLAVVS